MRGPVLAFAGVFLALAVLDLGALGLGWAFGDLLRLALIALVVSGLEGPGKNAKDTRSPLLGNFSRALEQKKGRGAATWLQENPRPQKF
jgi:hypothetical protein